jgi:hypothetical protein
MTVASFFRKYSVGRVGLVGCILNYVRLIITHENILYIYTVTPAALH